MDIAVTSMSLSQMKVAQQASISVLKMAMDSGKTQIDDMTKMLNQNMEIIERSVQPHLGKNIDFRV